MKVLACIVLAIALAGCGAKKPSYRGGQPGGKPYTVAGKTYYPLKSAHGFMEEGTASWYGPGFHGKKTANGETYNQFGMTAAHKILPLGTRVRVTHLGTGKSVVVRVNDRGPFVDDRVIDLSRAAATRLGIMGTGTAAVRVQSIGDIAQAAASNDIRGDFYIQVGAFGDKANARKMIESLTQAGRSGRLFHGSNNMWNVQLGPWKDSASAEKMLPQIKTVFARAFVVGAK